MKLTQVNPDTRPDLFKVRVPVLDVDGNPTYEDVVDPDTGVVTQEPVTEWAGVRVNPQFDSLSLSKRSARGIQDLRLYDDDTVLYHTLDADGVTYKVASQHVYLESLVAGNWIRHSGIKEVTLPDVGKVNAHVDDTPSNANLVVDADWNPNNGKQTFTVARPGYLVRCVWVVTRHEQYDDLKLDYSDYQGNVQDSDWIDNVRTIIFEPAGVQDTLLVDPYLILVEAATTITVDFDSGDSVVWTIATENAVLLENTSIRVCIHEDYFRWYVYDTYMLRWQHDTAALTTGADFTGNTYCIDANKVQISTYDYYLYPATSTVNTNKITYATELADISTGITTGSAVTDLNWPDEIGTGTDGACFDGAFHVASDANNAGKITWDSTRNLPAVVIEDWPIMSGDPASPTEHLLFWDKMDSVTDGHTPEYSAGGDIVTVTNSPVLDNGVSGDGVNFSTASSKFSIPSAVNINKDTGCISFDYAVNDATDISHRKFLFLFSVGTDDYFFARIDDNTGGPLYFYYGNKLFNIDSFQSTYLQSGVFVNIKICWRQDGTAIWQAAFVNGKLIHQQYIASGYQQDALATNADLCGFGTDNEIDGIIDNFKIYNTPILPYGSYIPANIISGDVVYSMAHGDITAYVHGDETDTNSLKIGTGTITVTGATHTTGPDGVADSALTVVNATDKIYFPNNISSAGMIFISFWFKADFDTQTNDVYRHIIGGNQSGIIAGDWYLWWSYPESRIAIAFTDNTATEYHVYYNNLTHGVVQGEWNHYLFCINDSAPVFGLIYNFGLILNGVLLTPDTGSNSYTNWSANRPTLHTNAYLLSWEGGDSYQAPGSIHGVTITSDPNTPQLWTANGKPLILPDFKSEVL